MENSFEDTQLKPVSKNDAEFLHRLMNDASVLQVLNEVPTQLQDWTDAIDAWSRDDDEEDYIIFCGDTPIGWLGVNGLLSDDHSAYLKMAAFLPEYQGQGYGTNAIQKLMCDLKRRGIEKMILFADQCNELAQACYKKCGFYVVGSLIETMSNGKDVLRYKMEARLKG